MTTVIVNPDEDTEYVEYLSQLEAQGKITTTSRPLIAGNYETNLFKYDVVILDPHLQFEKSEYSQMSREAEIFTRDQEILDCAILSAMTELPVSSANYEGGRAVYFLDGGEPAWVPNVDLYDLTTALEEFDRYYFVSNDPTMYIVVHNFELLNLQAPVKNSKCDIWAVKDLNLITPALAHLEKVRASGCFCVVLPSNEQQLVAREIMMAYAYVPYSVSLHLNRIIERPIQSQPYLLPNGVLALNGDFPFDETFFLQALEDVYLNSTIPQISVPLGLSNLNDDLRKCFFIDRYVKQLNIGGATSYATPFAIKNLILVNSVLTFMCHSRFLYNAMLQIPLNPAEYSIIPKDTIDEALELRYRLSLGGIRSYLIDGVFERYYVCVNLKDNRITQDRVDEVANRTPETPLRDALLRIFSTLREPSDPVSMTSFKDLDVEGLSRLVISESGYGYELETFQKLEFRDPMTRKPFPPSMIIRAGYNIYGYYTYGPYVGILDSPTYLELQPQYRARVMITSINPYYPDADEESVPSSKYVDITFSVILGMESESKYLCELYVPIGEEEKTRLSIENAVQRGLFSTPWSRAYKQTFGIESNVNFKVPPLVEDGSESPQKSELAIAYIEVYSQ